MKPSEMRRVAYLALKSGLSAKQFQHLCVKALIREAMQSNQYNQCKAAKAIQMHRNTLYRWMKTPDGEKQASSIGREAR